jgi:hypothetical protein
MVAIACSGMSWLTISFNLPGNKLETSERPNHTVAIPGPKIYILTIACCNDEPFSTFCESTSPLHVR